MGGSAGSHLSSLPAQRVRGFSCSFVVGVLVTPLRVYSSPGTFSRRRGGIDPGVFCAIAREGASEFRRQDPRPVSHLPAGLLPAFSRQSARLRESAEAKR